MSIPKKSGSRDNGLLQHNNNFIGKGMGIFKYIFTSHGQ